MIKLVRMLLFICLLFTIGCQKKQEQETYEIGTIFEKPVPANIDFLKRGSIEIISAPDPEGDSKIGNINKAEKESDKDPKITVEILEKYIAGNNYWIVVNFRNTVEREGNKTINFYAYDENGRLVHVLTEVYYFRKFQNYLKKYNTNVNARQVRWILQVN